MIDDPHAAVRAAIIAQEAAWNAGDFEGFLRYWSTDVRYLGPRGLTCGREAVGALLAAQFASGLFKLSSEILDLRAFGDRATVVLRWDALTVSGNSGYTLMNLALRPDGWSIVEHATVIGARAT